MSKPKPSVEQQGGPPAPGWDLRDLFESEAAYEAALAAVSVEAEQGARLRGSISLSPEHALACLAWEDRVQRQLERLSCYAWSLVVASPTERSHHARLGRFEAVGGRVDAAASFVDPELLQLPEERLRDMTADDRFGPYRARLLKAQRRRSHTLERETEEILAGLESALSAPERVQQVLLNLDLRPEAIAGPDGSEWIVDRGGYVRALRHEDRDFRARAQTAYFEAIGLHRHTLSALLSYRYQADATVARARGFESAIDAALHDEGMPKTVVDQLMASVDDLLGPYHLFVDLRRRRHGLDSLHGYDTRLRPVPDSDRHLSYDAGASILLDAVEPLGAAYQEQLRDMVLGGWTDATPSPGKREACNPCHDVHPYVSVAYQGDLRSLSVLAHETGHGMHHWLLAQSNPFAATEVGPFLGEIASKTQEFLLAEHLSEHAGSPLERAHAAVHLVNLVADGLYWNAQLTELELALREAAEAGAELDADRVQDLHVRLGRRYLGPHASVDDEEGLEALIIPHLYLGLYNCTYATGTVAAVQLVSALREGHPGARESYLGLLRSGTDVLPMDALLRAGVDLSRPEPYEATARWLDQRVSMLEASLEDA